MTVPEVSILMPVYNGARFIDEALESVEKQDGIDAEIVVVVDTRSTDATADIVAVRASKDARIQPVPFDGPGLFGALNLGLDRAQGRYITFLDADDISAPGRIARQLRKLEDRPAVGAVVGELLMFERLDRDLQPVAGTRWTRILSLNLGAGTFRRVAIDAVGSFDESFVGSGDVDFMLRLHDSGWPIEPEQDLALLCRKHDSNMSKNANDVQRELLMALQRSIARRRKAGEPHNPLPFPLMKPLTEIEGSEGGFPGHRSANLFKKPDKS